MKSHTEIAVASIRCFSDDGTLDIGELNFLLGLALRDGVVYDEEKRVLNNIFSKVGQTDVTPIVWDRIKEIKQQHNL